MRIQNYQTNCNNRPSFKENTVVTEKTLTGIMGVASDIYKTVAKMADNGATSDAIIPVKDGYLAPDPSTFIGGVITAAKKRLDGIKNISDFQFSKEVADLESLAEEIAGSPATKRM